jgi:hypothetical protein
LPLFILDGRDHRFMGLAGRAIVCSQIKTGFLRFDLGQKQRSAAFGARRPEVIDKLEVKRVYHDEIPCSRDRACARPLENIGSDRPVAFSRTGDPATGDFGDATVLRKFGDVPDDLMGGDS